MPPSRDAVEWPTDGWRFASADECVAAGFDDETATALDEYVWNSYPQIRAIVVVRHGAIVYERYDGCAPENYHAVYSVTKSVVSALFGIMLRDGLLQSLEQHVLDILPEYDQPGLDPRV